MTRYPTLPTIKEAASLAMSWKRRARLGRVAGGGGEVSLRTGRRAPEPPRRRSHHHQIHPHTLHRNGSSAARNDRIACSRSCGVRVAWAITTSRSRSRKPLAMGLPRFCLCPLFLAPPGRSPKTPVIALFCADPCRAMDLSVFHRLDVARPRGQGRGVPKPSSDHLRRRPSRGPVTTRW